MTLFVLDTDILSLFQEGHERVCRRVYCHSLDELATTVITVEEQLSGWYSLVRRAKGPERLARAYQRLADSVTFLAHFRILPFTESAIGRYAHLQGLKLGTKKMDLRIAAITLEHGGTIVTRNVRDFREIPGIVIEDWAAEDG
ncbi:MAG TPA: type II toxin-antitoxin system VapC family toxin [Candidatus Anammoximicrobium sp.]|nr:type II toxin-antitoxin system VapC family toxin [Candidatus Anammoximicrobium sp.]